MTLSRAEIAERVAKDLPDGAYVNLGIGIPTLVANYIPADREVVLHTENGMLGMGPEASESEIDDDLINAGKVFVTERPGASYFHHADSFSIIRGGHIDYAVMGAFQVSTAGDLSNWRTNSPDVLPGVGGAMDLAAGARNVFIIMELFTKSGEPKLVADCTYPITGAQCVDRVYSDVALFEFTDGRVRVVEIYTDSTVEELSTRLGIPLEDGVTRDATVAS